MNGRVHLALRLVVRLVVVVPSESSYVPCLVDKLMELGYEVLEDGLDDSVVTASTNHITYDLYNKHGLGVCSIELIISELMTSALSGY